ncbi:NAD(P)-binding protein [Xylariomycetidae sp. FL2044]|nr:NAD(P)-binding protein [Xylariomycetidae sp. FL2044]
MARQIKAWTYTHGGYPQALEESTIPVDPAPLKPTELRVQTKAVSVNPVDAQLMGFPLWAYLPRFVVAPRKGVGEDFSGVVLEAGAAAGFRAGDAVFGITPFLPGGTFQEEIRIDTAHRESVVLAKPDGWTWERAAALPLVWLTAQTTIAEAAPFVKKKKEDEEEGGKVAVLGGSSASGMYAVHLAKQRGWTVLSTCSGRNAAFVRSMGADRTVDYTATPDLRAAVAAFAPDAIIDCVGGTACLGAAPRYVTVVGDKTHRLAMGGRNLYLWNPRMLARALRGRVGGWWGRRSSSYTCINLGYEREWLEALLQLPEDKVVIDSIFEFGQVREAFERALALGRLFTFAKDE